MKNGIYIDKMTISITTRDRKFGTALLRSHLFGADNIKRLFQQTIREKNVSKNIRAEKQTIDLGCIRLTDFSHRLKQKFIALLFNFPEEITISEKTAAQNTRFSTSQDLYSFALCCLHPCEYQQLIKRYSAIQLQQKQQQLLSPPIVKKLPSFTSSYSRITASRLAFCALLYLLNDENGRQWLSENTPQIQQWQKWTAAIERGEIFISHVLRFIQLILCNTSFDFFTKKQDPSYPEKHFYSETPSKTPIKKVMAASVKTKALLLSQQSQIVYRWLLPLWEKKLIRNAISRHSGKEIIENIEQAIKNILQKKQEVNFHSNEVFSSQDHIFPLIEQNRKTHSLSQKMHSEHNKKLSHVKENPDFDPTQMRNDVENPVAFHPEKTDFFAEKNKTMLRSQPDAQQVSSDKNLAQIAAHQDKPMHSLSQKMHSEHNQKLSHVKENPDFDPTQMRNDVENPVAFHPEKTDFFAEKNKTMPRSQADTRKVTSDKNQAQIAAHQDQPTDFLSQKTHSEKNQKLSHVKENSFFRANSLFVPASGEKHPPSESFIDASNAGILLLWFMLPPLFSALKLCEKGKFINDSARWQAVIAIDWLIWSQEKPPEARLMMNRLICGLPLSGSVPELAALNDDQQHFIRDWITAFIDQIPAFQRLTIIDIQALFLQRAGQIAITRVPPQIYVQPQPFDFLLNDWSWPSFPGLKNR